MNTDRSAPPDPDVFEALQAEAAALCVEDLFLFRRVGGEQFVHLGGLGRGVGWAGIIELDLADNDIAARAYRNNTIEYREHDTVGHVVGAYHARSAAVIPFSKDVLVVAGNFGHRIGLNTADDDWRRLAARATAVVTSVSPAKRLADELEVLYAVQAINTLDADRELADVLQAIVTIAADSLTCEIGLGWLDDGTVAANPGGQPVCAQTDAWALRRDILASAPQSMESSHCQQDARQRMLPPPLGEQASSWLLLRLPDPAPGWMLFVHTVDNARGFSDLCLELARQLPPAASGVLATTLMRDSLRADAQTARAQAERDILTNVGNRMAWRRAIEAEQSAVDDGRPAAVLIIDVDNLKVTNDCFGHDIGDQVLVATAATLTAQSGDRDSVVRLGGDEFALLLPNHTAAKTDQRVARIRAALAVHPWINGQIALRASIGACVASPGDQLREAITRADDAMYAEKTRGQPRDCQKIGQESAP